jgi:lipopolysaccharide export system protein LptC
MINPRFTGRDQRGDPYQIIAAAAMRDPSSPALTELETPRLDLLAGAALGSVVVSEFGVFDRYGRTLDLSGKVRLDTGNGYTFITEAARVFVDENRVAGSVSVEGSGPIGTIRGDGFEILDGGARIRFSGGVVARINQEPKLAPPLTPPPE